MTQRCGVGLPSCAAAIAQRHVHVFCCALRVFFLFSVFAVVPSLGVVHVPFFHLLLC